MKTLVILALLAIGTLSYAGDMERAEAIQKIKEQIGSAQNLINNLENPNIEIKIKLYHRTKIEEASPNIHFYFSVNIIDINDDLLLYDIDTQQLKKDWIEKLKNKKSLLERQLHDMLWCK